MNTFGGGIKGKKLGNTKERLSELSKNTLIITVEESKILNKGIFWDLMKGNMRMKIQNMIYALRNDELVYISEVESGLKCGCICPACGEVLIARKGSKMSHHFAHKSTIECEYGYQTSLHLAAKKIISENPQITVPALYLTFPGTGRKELIENEQTLVVSNIILEKKIDNIIPDILLVTDIGEIIVEIFVTHEIDDEKKKKIKKLNIPTIEIDLSKFDRNITDEDLKQALLSQNKNKSWVYNGKREKTYKRFIEVSECKDVKVRNYALHVDNCPIKKRVWRGKPYANLDHDCWGCDYLIDYKELRINDVKQDRKMLCSGKLRIGSLEDFDIPLEIRLQDYDEKREEEIYDLISQGICPQCGYDLKIRQSKYGEFFGCSNYPHCLFTFNYDEN